MATLAPPLECTVELMSGLQNGLSLRESLFSFIQKHSADRLSKDLEALILNFDRGTTQEDIIERQSNLYRRTLLDLILAGLAGQSILSQLKDLQGELRMAAELEVRTQLESLPLKMLMPLLLVQFPAFLILLFGPLLNQLITELSR